MERDPGKHREKKVLPNTRRCIAQLEQSYPNAIFRNPHKMQPLSELAIIKIKSQQSGRFRENVLSDAIRTYVSSRSYMTAVANGKAEILLDGRPSGEPDHESIEFAKSWLKRND